MLHLAFILILVGAFVTRYIGFEGMMAIREGDTEQNFLSQKPTSRFMWMAITK